MCLLASPYFQAHKYERVAFLDRRSSENLFTANPVESLCYRATRAEIREATAWQRHTVRVFVSILNKGGAKIESSKSEAGAWTYKAA